ncbi:MAG: histidine phosphatase family protein [Candidatus Dormibacteraeota bacterium]|nr:histidine phosphatase family protein [Candidatus Dormibacteraeota bacterium]
MPSPIATRLYLVRHCDVENPDGVLYGHLPSFGLSSKGLVQAEALGRFFSTTTARAIITSPLDRARQTAQIIASHIDSIPVSEDADLIEARFGLYLQGVRPRDVPWRRPLWFVHMAWPGVLRRDESVKAMAERVRRPLMHLLRDHPGDGGICVSHGDPIQAFWVDHEHRPPYALHRLQCMKGGMLVLDYADDRLQRLEYWPPERIRDSRGLPEPLGVEGDPYALSRALDEIRGDA